MMPGEFEKDYRIGFDELTVLMNKWLPGYQFMEFHMPGNRIERWWIGDAETLSIAYKKDKKEIP